MLIGFDEITEEPHQEENAQTIDEMIDVCLHALDGGPAEFIQSLNLYYEKHGRLSDKQFNALKKFYDNI